MPAASSPWPNPQTIRDLFWLEPERRGHLAAGQFSICRAACSRTIRSDVFEIRVSTDFPGHHRRLRRTHARAPENLDQFAKSAGSTANSSTWAIATRSKPGRTDELVGGLYGVSLNGAFFGESMFTFRTDASKVCLAHLVARLIVGGYSLLDTQFVTDHLSKFGALEMSAGGIQHKRLAEALKLETDFYALPTHAGGQEVLSVLDACRAT